MVFSVCIFEVEDLIPKFIFLVFDFVTSKNVMTPPCIRVAGRSESATNMSSRKGLVNGRDPAGAKRCAAIERSRSAINMYSRKV